MRPCLDCGRPALPGRGRCRACHGRRERIRLADRPPRRPPPGWAALRRAVLASGPCHLCGGAGPDVVDHVVPLARGGSWDRSNLAPAHAACNARKGAVV